MNFTDVLKRLEEGNIKKAMETKIEKVCDCDGGCSLNPDDHDKKCPAKKMLKDADYGSWEIDRSDYMSGKDR